jgi:hypothetical protein
MVWAGRVAKYELNKRSKSTCTKTMPARNASHIEAGGRSSSFGTIVGMGGGMGLVSKMRSHCVVGFMVIKLISKNETYIYFFSQKNETP